MYGVKLVTSDDNEDLGAARGAIVGSMSWQRCQPVLGGQSRVPPAAERGVIFAQAIYAPGSGNFLDGRLKKFFNSLPLRDIEYGSDVGCCFRSMLFSLPGGESC